MTWEACPACGSQDVTVIHAGDLDELHPETLEPALQVGTSRHPALSIKEDVVVLRCVSCGQEWEG